MRRVAAITVGKNDPSARFRVRELIAPLQTCGYQVEESYPLIPKYAPLPARIPGKLKPLWQAGKVITRMPALSTAKKADITWLQRELVDSSFTFEAKLKRPLVFDLDDAIWMQGWWPISAMQLQLVNADTVFAGNAYIADWCSQFTDRIAIIPTAIDCNRFCPAENRGAFPKFVVGWTGTHWTIGYLRALGDVLACFMQKHADVELHVVGNIEPQMSSLPQERVKFIRWTPELEAPSLQSFSVGLMPLEDDVFSRAKCSCKMLQYMASGVPVVVSPVGLNATILDQASCGLPATSHDEWYDALEAVYADQSAAAQMGVAGRNLALEAYSTTVVAQRIAQEFDKLLVQA